MTRHLGPVQYHLSHMLAAAFWSRHLDLNDFVRSTGTIDSPNEVISRRGLGPCAGDPSIQVAFSGLDVGEFDPLVLEDK